ncbi:MAG: hypothetical protein S4CHLAM102_06930 [Chlamydiia bacterium]|nr:hypothetical protein [Chlamydiia bacterium]
MGSYESVFLVASLVAIVVMFVAWLFYLVVRVQLGRGIATFLVALIALVSNPQLYWKKGVMLTLLLAWGGKSAFILLTTRILPAIRRQREQRDPLGVKEAISRLFLYEAQIVVILGLTLPFFFVGHGGARPFGLLDGIGTVLIGFGILGSMGADFQLYQFKSAFPGSVCKTRLWAWSRHPNYFFEFLTTVGFTCFALTYPFGWVALASPIISYLFLGSVIAPKREKRMRGIDAVEYAVYQKEVPKFFPLRIRRFKIDKDES